MLLSVLPNYCEQFSSNQTTKSYPKVLTELYDEKYKGLNYANLLLKCDEISFAVNFTEEHAKLIFSETQKWYDFRYGRVTASVSGEVCNSRDEIPPVSLIKKYAINQNLEVWLQIGIIKTKMMPVIRLQIYVRFSCKSFCEFIWPYTESQVSLSWRISRWYSQLFVLWTSMLRDKVPFEIQRQSY